MTAPRADRAEADRHRIHRAGVALTEFELLRRGCDVVAQNGDEPITLLAWSVYRRQRLRPHTIAVRACRVTSMQTRVQVKGKRYFYRYRCLHWNLHSHAERRARPDYWVLVAVERQKRSYISRVFIVPGSELEHAKTVRLQAEQLPGRGGAAVRRFEGRWDLITGRRARPSDGAAPVGGRAA